MNYQMIMFYRNAQDTNYYQGHRNAVVTGATASPKCLVVTLHFFSFDQKELLHTLAC